MDTDSDNEIRTRGLVSCPNLPAVSRGVVQGQPQTLVKPMTLFGEKRTPIACQVNNKEAAILDRIWPGSHDVVLVIRFVLCHFAGDWTTYLPFAHWADSQSLDYPNSYICLDKWHSLKSDAGDSIAIGGYPTNASAGHLGDRGTSEEGLRSSRHGGGWLETKLCNKTCNDSVDFSAPRLYRKSSSIIGNAQCTSPNKAPHARSSSSHPDICIMFPTMRALTPTEVAAAQAMKDNIELQETGQCKPTMYKYCR